MAKRFTATEKWDKQWFMDLSPKLKCLWQYINDKCDQAGMWEANFKLASMYIGEKVTEDDLKNFGHRIELYEPGKFWVTGHVDFQYGTPTEKSPAHRPLIRLLKKYNLLDRVLNRVSNTLKEKEIEKEKETEEEEERGAGENIQTPDEVHIHPLIEKILKDYPRVQQMEEPLTPEQADRLLADYPESLVMDIVSQMHNWKPLHKGNQSANLTIRNWIKRNNEKSNTGKSTGNSNSASTSPKIGRSTEESLRKFAAERSMPGSV